MALGEIIPVILFSMTLIKADIISNIVSVHFKAVLDDCTDNVNLETTVYQTFQVRSRSHCFTTCSQNDSCKSVIFQRQNKNCLLLNSKTPCVASSGVSNSVYVITEKIEMDGTLQQTTETSLATTSVAEVMIAETTPVSSITSVQESLITETASVSSSANYGTIDSAGCLYYGNIYPLELKTTQPISLKPPFQVWCAEWYGAIILRNTQKDSSFLNKDFQHFKNGFGDVNGDHMQSLDNIHILTSSYSCDLMLMLDSMSESSVYQIVKYKNVHVANSTLNYKITFESVASFLNPYNQLEQINGTMFSARDSDLDTNNNVNCAGLNKNGFWYNSFCNGCVPVNASSCFLRDMVFARMALSPSKLSTPFWEYMTNGYDNNQNFPNSNW